MRNSHRWLCGVEKKHCCGGATLVGKKHLSAHSTSKEAFNCMKRYLLSQGYEQIGAKEFKPPDNGPIRVLTRPGKYGAQVRLGKNESNQITRKTFKNNWGSTGGTIIG